MVLFRSFVSGSVRCVFAPWIPNLLLDEHDARVDAKRSYLSWPCLRAGWMVFGSGVGLVRVCLSPSCVAYCVLHVCLGCLVICTLSSIAFISSWVNKIYGACQGCFTTIVDPHVY